MSTTSPTVPRLPRGPSLDDLSLRQKERGFVVGGTDTGKSTLADFLGADFVHRYADKKARRLILDSKPRYRAQWTVQGVSAARRYKNWDHGAPIAGSVVVDNPDDLELAWKTGATTVIVQRLGAKRIDIARMVRATELFMLSSRARRPQLLQVDETLDFFHGNGAPIGNSDALVEAARAGRERGTAALYCSQRTKGMPAQLMEEMSRLYAFRIDYKADAKRLQEMGAPPIPLPTKTRQFMYWWKGDYDRVWGPYTLDLAA